MFKKTFGNVIGFTRNGKNRLNRLQTGSVDGIGISAAKPGMTFMENSVTTALYGFIPGWFTL
jgi:hypothetical protein